MSPLIEINDPSLSNPQTIIIDVRGGKDAFERYLSGHLKKAAFVNLDTDLAAPVTNASVGGRHPLPSLAAFTALLATLGIGPQSHVIVYDDKFAAMGAARFWWMLTAIGHTGIQVLNGGLRAAVDAGLELNTENYMPVTVEPYPAAHDYAGTVDMKTTGKAAQNQSKLVIDVRETPRYLGQTEPIDLIAGHIPGAANLPYVSNMGADGKFLSPAVLRKAYLDALGTVDPADMVVHCGSGVTACHTLLGMEYAGIEGGALYVGSWSEWSRNDLPIATGER